MGFAQMLHAWKTTLVRDSQHLWSVVPKDPHPSTDQTEWKPDRKIFFQQTVQKSESKLEKAQVATICSVDLALPSVPEGQYSESNDQVVGKKGSHQQAIDALGIREVTLLQIKSAAFLIRKAGLDFEAFSVKAAGFIRTGYVCHQVYGFLAVLSPPCQCRYRAIAPLCEQSVGHYSHLAGLHVREDLFVLEPVVLPAQCVGFGCPQNVLPLPVLYDTLQVDTIELSVSQEDDPWPVRDHVFHLLNQFNMPLIR
jgi:hypothetical protein